ncbi:MAG TPA: sigma-70 family RNA polymerase sigma factor [Ktedonobacteraceae bacterium]
MVLEQKEKRSAHGHSGHPVSLSTLTCLPGNTDVSAHIEPYRHELCLHCYRMMGSLHDAEDLVQETMLRAWQRFDTFREAASLRTWLYAIATHLCLDALKKPQRRTLPMASYPAADPAEPIAVPTPDAPWLEPFPSLWLEEATDNPETRYTRRETVSLAFLIALQLLPPRQRAVLILSDVLDWHASEVARLLDMSVSAVNSALHRARVTLARNYQATEPERTLVHADAATDALLKRYIYAWENDDIAGLVALLKEDATLNMPPYPSWYAGREAIGTLLAATALGTGIEHLWRMYPTGANARPAVALYRACPSKHCYEAFGIQIVTPDDARQPAQIAAITSFHRSSLVAAFGFPPQIPA